MQTLSLVIDETKWQYALDKANAPGQKAADAAKTTFVPLTLQEYAQSIIDGLGNSYAAQQTRDHIAVISAQPAPDIARLAKAASLPDGPERTQLAATVDALA